MTPHPDYHWLCGERLVVLGERTLIMGVLNVTLDSFSDGGHFTSPDVAIERALEMVEQGADIIDIGGESTRPGAESIATAEEIRRTVPLIKKIRAQSTVLISIDTMKAETALRAMEAGADIINDISAFEADEGMVEVAAQTRAGVILMHMQGSPQTMQNKPHYQNVVHEVRAYLERRIEFAVQHGVRREGIVVDPGIGFGKTVEHNLDLLRGLPAFEACGRPVLVGASRKSFIGQITHQKEPQKRLAGSLGIAAWAIMQGAHLLRVHDVIDTCDVCMLLDTLLDGESSCS